MSLSRRGFGENTTFPKPLGCGKCQMCQNQKARDGSLLPDAHGPTGWTWSSFSGLRSCGAAAALRPLNTAPFLTAFVPQNTTLDNHKPSTPFHDPAKKHIFVRKSCFSTINCSEWIAVLPVSYLPFMRRRGRTLM